MKKTFILIIFIACLITSPAQATTLPGFGISGGRYVDKLYSLVPSLSWFHDWNGCSGGDNSKQIPCQWYGNFYYDSAPPTVCPASKTFIWLNEPDGLFIEGQPYLDPTEAAAKSHDVKAQLASLCGSNITFVVGGTIQAGTTWLDTYFAAGGEGDTVHTHCYQYSSQGCQTLLQNFAQKYPNYCLTEWAFLGPDPLNADRLQNARNYMTWVRDNVPCQTYFIDYLSYSPWSGGYQPRLFTTEGDLTPLGLVYFDVFNRSGDINNSGNIDRLDLDLAQKNIFTYGLVVKNYGK